jgi:Family of unknown function (DUF6188)
MVDSVDAPSLQLEGAELTSIRIDSQTHLTFGAAEVTIGTPFRITSGGVKHELDPETQSALGPLLAIYPTTVLSAGIDTHLTLRLEFTGGEVLEVAEDPSYESWEIRGPGSRLIVCPPAGGGGLAVWN